MGDTPPCLITLAPRSSRILKAHCPLPYLLSLLSGVSLAVSWLMPGEGPCAALGWIAVILFILSLENPSQLSQSARGGTTQPLRCISTPYRLCWIAGITAIAIAFSWLARTIAIFSGLPSSAAVAVFCLFVAGSALQFPLTFWCAIRLPPWFHRHGLAYPLGWIAGEMVSPRIFPWHLGHTQLAVRSFALAASLAGAGLLSFVMVWVSSSLVIAITRRSYRPLLASLLVLGAAIGYGTTERIRYQRVNHPTISVALIQANVSLEHKHDISYFETNVDSYRSLSDAVPESTELVIWPESVIQRFIPDSIISSTHSRFLPPPLPDRDLLVGSLTFTSDRRPRNSALVIREDGSIPPIYHKQILMPFGEYTPFGEFLPWIAQLNDRVANFAAGTGPIVIPLSSTPTAKLAPLICYEDTVPSLSREAVRAGATLLASLSNDAWFGDSVASDQHELIAAFRAIETRRTLLRSTNTGTTGIIDPIGNSLGRLPPFSEGVLSAAVPIVADIDTPFSRYWGEWPTRILGWATFLWGVWTAMLRRPKVNS